MDHLSDTLTNLINHSTGITSPPPFYTKRPNKLQIPKYKLFPKRHHFSQPKITFQPSTVPPSEQHPSLSNYFTPNSHPKDNLATQHDTIINTSVTSNTDTPIKIYSRASYPFLRHLLELSLSLLVNSLPQHFAPLHHFQILKLSILPKKLFKIATPPTLETLVEIHVPQINSTPIILAVLKSSPSKVDKSTR